MNQIDPRWPFFSLDVELTTACERFCAFCPRECLSRPQGEMSESTWQKILSEAAKTGSRLAFSGMGDPLRHPHWHAWIKEARERKLTAGLVVPGGALSEEVVSRLLESCPSFVEVSVPSLRPEVFSALQPKDQFSSVLDQVQKLLALGRNRLTIVVVGLQTGLNENEESDFTSFWASNGIESRMFPCHSRGGNLDKPELIKAKITTETKCGLFARHSFLTWSGELLACCHDLSGNTRLGNVNISSFHELATAKIEKLNSAVSFALCASCDELRRAWPIPLSESFPNSPSGRRRAMRRLARSSP